MKVLPESWWGHPVRQRLISDLEDPVIADGIAIQLLRIKAQADTDETPFTERYLNCYMEIWGTYAKDAGLVSFEAGEGVIPFLHDKKSPQAKAKTLSQEEQAEYEKLLAEIYAKYPLKKGKAAGLKAARSKFKTPLELSKLSLAVDGYSAWIKSKSQEQKYIKHFSTFVNSGWEDYFGNDHAPVKPKKLF